MAKRFVSNHGRHLSAIVHDGGWEALRKVIPQFNKEQMRRRGQFRQLVLTFLSQGADPLPADVAAALREPAPDPAAVAKVQLTEDEQHVVHSLETTEAIHAWARDNIPPERWDEARRIAAARIARETARLHDYVATTYVLARRPRTPGRKLPARTLAENNQIAADYFIALDNLRFTSDRRGLAKHVKARVARAHGISISTLESIVSKKRPRFI